MHLSNCNCRCSITKFNLVRNIVCCSHSTMEQWESATDCKLLLRVYVIKPVSFCWSIRTSVCPSTKRFSDTTKFGVSVEVDDWYTMVFRMTWSKVKVTEVRTLLKWLISESVSSASKHAIKRIMVNSDTPTKTMSELLQDRFCDIFLVQHHTTFKVCLYKESTDSPVWGLFIDYCYFMWSLQQNALEFKTSSCMARRPPRRDFTD